MALWREVLLTLVAVVGAACLVAAAASTLFGVTTYVVRSGSMAPSIRAGDLVVTHRVPADRLEVDDVVTVPKADGSRVTHRITAIRPGDDGARLTLKGDVNERADGSTYRVESADRVFTHIPYLGYPVNWTQTPVGLGVVGSVVVVAAASLLAPRRREAVAVGAAVALVAGLVAAGGAPRSTAATFGDDATLQTGALSATTVVRPDPLSCVGGSLSAGATLSWPANPLYDYEVILRRISSGAIVSTRQVLGTGHSVHYAGTGDFHITGYGTFTFKVEVRSKLASAPTWQSATVRTYSSLQVYRGWFSSTVTCTT